MHLNTTPPESPRKPCMRDYSQLIAPTGLLPEALVQVVPLKQLKRRIREINYTHPQYQEETPVLLAIETERRQRLAGGMRVVREQVKVA